MPEVDFDSPLEIRLRELVEADSGKFPYTSENRFEIYKRIKSKLQQEYYPDIGSALSRDSGGSAFTRHDLSHVDEVIRRAGQLLGTNSEVDDAAIEMVRPYELFVLLVGCLIHDVGNIEGRTDHAARARPVLREVCGGSLEQLEIRMISQIARAHGGKTVEGSLDTIGALGVRAGVEDCDIRPRFLAAVLRFADELAENSRRANRSTGDGSRFPNLYCENINVSVDYKSRWINLNFVVSDDEAILHEADDSGQEMYFVDYIAKRVVKTEIERRYCDRFLRGNRVSFDSLRVDVEFLKNDLEWRPNKVFELMDGGYPSNTAVQQKIHAEIDGSDLATEYRTAFSDEASDD